LEAQVLTAKIGRETLGVPKIGKGHDAIDLVTRESGILDRAHGSLELERQQAEPRARLPHVGGLADPDDADLVLHSIDPFFTLPAPAYFTRFVGSIPVSRARFNPRKAERISAVISG